MAENFDTLFPGIISGTMEITMIDQDQNPNLVLERTAQCQVVVDWRLKGPGASSIMGNWHVTASVESLGAGYEGALAPTVTVNLGTVQPDSTPTNRHFLTTISVVPSSIVGLNDGVYKLVTLITYTDPFNIPGAMAAFSENPVVSFYTP